jgi:alkanesulfonate monooxygenase SsuD/methylene tetrahydromethanopterin reductase-like flavin-dependent oxidoreductase (luciferase family)
MRFGTFHLLGSPDMAPAGERFDDTLDHIALADELGFHTVWIAEHHFSNYGYSANPLLLIARASTNAPRVRFGQAVLVAPFWHPLRLAEDIAITDLLTHGRMEVGLGRGYQPLEFEGLDIDMRHSRAMFEETYDLLRLAWTADDFTYAGQHYNVPTPITVLPRPHQQPHPPVWLAVQSETSLDWAADHGCDVLLTGGSTWEELARWTARYLARHTPAPDNPTRAPRVGVLRHVLATESEADARAAFWQSRWQRAVAHRLRLGEQQITAGRNDLTDYVAELSEEEWWDRVVYGTPERCIAQLQRQAKMGITDFLAWFDIGGLPADQVQRSMQLFAAEVIPALSHAPVGG